MQLAEVESVIARANGSSNHYDQKQANETLEQLKMAADSWSWGMRLFFESSQPVARFFGLSLVRGQLIEASRLPVLDHRRQIRTSLITWVQQVLSSSSTGPEGYLMSNVTAVLTLCIKHDFPEDWRSAFSELLALGALSAAGTDLVLGVLENFDADVVIFNEARSRDEWTHNTVIKDCMRTEGINASIVDFLLQRCVALRPHASETSAKCLSILSLFVSWVDINLLLPQTTLALLYQALTDSMLWGGACLCLTEIVKKGVTPVHRKMELLAATQILDVLSRTIEGTVDDDLADSLAALVDAVFLEVLEVWSACEAGGEARAFAPQVGQALHRCMSCVLPLFRHSNFDATVALVPSLNRFAQVLRAQAKAPGDELWSAFDPKQYLNDYLTAVYHKLQFDEDFSFDPADEDDCEEVEGKKEVRKLFVGAARVYPEECLRLISATLTALPSPLSSAPFPATEAALKLVLAYGDCGVLNSSHVKEGAFPGVVKALHESDVGHHPHVQIRLNYFELSARYARQCSMESIHRIVSVLISEKGMRDSDAQVRCRAAYFFLKVVESCSDKAGDLLPIVGTFSGKTAA